MTWALINDSDGSWAAGPLDDQPTPSAGQSVVGVPTNYPDACLWSPALRGFVDIAPPAPLISVGRFKLLFTQAERIQLRAAAAQDAHVADFLDLLAGFSDGVSLFDAVMAGAIGQLQTGGLLTADRAAAILKGENP